MLKKIIKKTENNVEEEAKSLIEGFLIPEFKEMQNKNPDIDFFMIDFFQINDSDYLYDGLTGNTKEATLEILEQVENMIMPYGIQVFKKLDGITKYTFIQELHGR